MIKKLDRQDHEEKNKVISYELETGKFLLPDAVSSIQSGSSLERKSQHNKEVKKI